MNTKQEELNKIARDIALCRTCRKEMIGKPVPGEGNPDAQVVFVGEAPGKQEAMTGRPFVGRSGQLLRKYIQNIGLSEHDIFITSALKYLPERGTPSVRQIQEARSHLLEQLHVINPKIVVLLGKTAWRSLLEEDIPLKKEHGNSEKRDRRIYFPMFHPAAILRFPDLEKEFAEDFAKLKNLLQKE